MALITIEEALDQLRIVRADPDSGPDDTPDLIDIARKMDEASDIVLDWVTDDDKSYWTEDTAPGRVKAAVKLVLGALYDGEPDDPLSPAVKNILRRLRRPTLA